MAYVLEKRVSKTPERFGNGAIEGVASAETANNAYANAAMVPLLALGIPSSPTIAVLMGAFIINGITPGPFLFTERPDAGVDGDRQLLRRQRDAADPQPAAGRAVGQAAQDPVQLHVRRRADLLRDRRLRPEAEPVRRLGDAGLRHARLPAAQARLAARAGDPGADPGADDGEVAAHHAGDLRRQLRHLPRPAGGARAARRAGDRARLHAASSRARSPRSGKPTPNRSRIVKQGGTHADPSPYPARRLGAAALASPAIAPELPAQARSR